MKMNREIKFRIWDKKNKIFIYEWDASHKRLAISLVGLVYHGGYDDVLPENDYVVQQWTGLKDLKGIEIYEGDIVQYNVGSSYENMSFIVQWSGDSLGYILQSQSGDILTNSCTPNGNRFNFIELKGNIFETPELLK
jgi:hypothetical protein